MACGENVTTTNTCRRGNGYVVIIVLYILLAIILGGIVSY